MSPPADGRRCEHRRTDSLPSRRCTHGPDRYHRRRHHPNPFDKRWVDTALRDLAHRALNGEPRERLEEELLTALWPWTVRTAEAVAATVPPGTDRDAVRSEICWELFQSVRHIDWARYQVWPAFVKARLRGARSAAARRDDIMTRGQRRGRKLFVAAAEEQAQRLGRSLTPPEERALAARCCPRGGLDLVLSGTRPALSLEATAFDTPDPAAGPEDIVLHRAAARAISIWIDEDLPPRLAKAMHRWLDAQETSLPARLRRSLEPYVPALLQRLV